MQATKAAEPRPVICPTAVPPQKRAARPPRCAARLRASIAAAGPAPGPWAAARRRAVPADRALRGAAAARRPPQPPRPRERRPPPHTAPQGSDRARRSPPLPAPPRALRGSPRRRGGRARALRPHCVAGTSWPGARGAPRRQRGRPGGAGRRPPRAPIYSAGGSPPARGVLGSAPCCACRLGRGSRPLRAQPPVPCGAGAREEPALAGGGGGRREGAAPRDDPPVARAGSRALPFAVAAKSVAAAAVRYPGLQF